MNHGYHKLINDVREIGFEVKPRGLTCREVRPAAFTIRDASKGLYTGVSRKLNYRFLAVETLAYLAGWGGPKHAHLLIAANRNMSAFMNPDKLEFDGAYGPRLGKSLGDVVELLKRDPDSRQAVASIWEPGIPQGSKDVPCTLNLHFYRGQDGLDSIPTLCMTAAMRSNDLNWGTPYDVAAFCAIQCAIAACLGWHPGAYSHTAGSLHVYDDMTVYKDEAFQVLPFSDESFNGWVEVPYLSILAPKNPSWWTIKAGCCQLLQELFQHVVCQNRPWHEFDSTIFQEPGFNGEDSLEMLEYWKDWKDLICFRWQDFDATTGYYKGIVAGTQGGSAVPTPSV
jgi:hypothetical protein